MKHRQAARPCRRLRRRRRTAPTIRSACGAVELRLERRAQRTGREDPAVADAASPSITRIERSLASDGFCKPSSITMTLGARVAARSARPRRGHARRSSARRARAAAARRRHHGACAPASTTTDRRAGRHSRGSERTAARPRRAAFGDRDRGRGLAGAADGEIADADDRDAGARARAAPSAAPRWRHRSPQWGDSSAAVNPGFAPPERRRMHRAQRRSRSNCMR